MRYFWTFFWSLLLSHMTVYVVGSMNGTGYSFIQGIVLAIFFSLAAIFLGDGLLSDDTQS
ncbi:YjzD family protein [Bacillus marinisedimentorum]|uniref:YjzD family protein n=1 Tax=Bacillus marinisedimentorum TaxID=1821260 RepID=UPI0009F67FAC|nr:YjzD family protein [Bacillus marinisedimentorum]